ncbi:uncharacterized protein TRAVEDRAFT_47214 [Trametes versicolor FP-101664 SS1]|uniref:uncharacterized protein n=1 Tax=Trametes versicolor (strain FP-101664) TaxID=717944 RepID=UPI0004622E4C|nr:uncharacterized protein TRAVEDRAFT_47214 [Trametes versicolor FP-101664 SS1]EIW59916.1 hypothetical protein TRAVEDRAFT_47214 [Trametes versicolor FP-101664 SS1]
MPDKGYYGPYEPDAAPENAPMTTRLILQHFRRRGLGGVVDAHLKVYDTTNVRVVDASVIPIQRSAHPSSAVYGIARREGGDIIKAAQIDSERLAMSLVSSWEPLAPDASQGVLSHSG